MSIRRKIVFAAISIAVNAGLSNAQGSEACKLLPEHPDVLDRPNAARPNLPPGFCMAGYWPRVQPGLFYDLTEYGAVITILPLASADAAKQALAKNKKTGPNASYGDGGYETMEDPRATDGRARSDREYQNPRGARMWSIEELLRPVYGTSFTCGNLVVGVSANPSKGPAARDLVKELDSNLRSAGLCGSSLPTVVANNNTTKPPIETTGNGDKVFDGETARQIKEAANRNARHMVVLDRHWDPQQNCWVEERAFVGGIRGSDENQVSVGVGPSKTFCLNGTVYSADQVNSGQDGIAKARDGLASALETHAKYEAYLKNHPNDAAAKANYEKNRQWIDYYKDYIAKIERMIANSIPPQ
jgi:hypothetical protein